MNLLLNLSLTLLYDSKSPDRGDDSSDDSGDGGVAINGGSGNDCGGSGGSNDSNIWLTLQNEQNKQVNKNTPKPITQEIFVMEHYSFHHWKELPKLVALLY